MRRAATFVESIEIGAPSERVWRALSAPDGWVFFAGRGS